MDTNNSHDAKNLHQTLYQSQSSCNSEKEAVVTKKKTVYVNWSLVRKFDNCNQADEAVRTEGNWSLHYYHETEDGRKKYYRCSKLKRRGPQCSARMYLLFDNTSDSVYMFRANAEHDHNETIDQASSYGLSDNVKSEINKLLELKMKPKHILTNINKIDNIHVPKISQLRNYLSDHRRGQPTISLGELEAWLLSHSVIPLDPHEVFVVSYQIDNHNEYKPYFCFAITTKYLIEISKEANVIHVDAKYKIAWQGFPVFIYGTTDQKRTFRPLCLAIGDEQKDFNLILKGLRETIYECFESTWNPKVLVCDGDVNIQNAFRDVFGEDVIIRMCWAHVKKRIQDKLEKINKDLVHDVLNDVDVLHRMTNSNIFVEASEAFLKKYENQTEFITYFKKQWLVEHRIWFLGATPNSPSTNDALVSFIKGIIDSNTIRERFPLSHFLEVVNIMVNRWSTNCLPNLDHNSKVSLIGLKDWSDASQWAAKLKKVTVIREDDNYVYYQVSTSQRTTCEEQWETFDDFKKLNSTNWLILLPTDKNNWKNGKCNCRTFYNTRVCKHVIGLAIRLRYVAPPAGAKNVPGGEKKRRGRPPKAQRALITL